MKLDILLVATLLALGVAAAPRRHGASKDDSSKEVDDEDATEIGLGALDEYRDQDTEEDEEDDEETVEEGDDGGSESDEVTTVAGGSKLPTSTTSEEEEVEGGTTENLDPTNDNTVTSNAVPDCAGDKNVVNIILLPDYFSRLLQANAYFGGNGFEYPAPEDDNLGEYSWQENTIIDWQGEGQWAPIDPSIGDWNPEGPPDDGQWHPIDPSIGDWSPEGPPNDRQWHPNDPSIGDWSPEGPPDDGRW